MKTATFLITNPQYYVKIQHESLHPNSRQDVSIPLDSLHSNSAEFQINNLIGLTYTIFPDIHGYRNGNTKYHLSALDLFPFDLVPF